MKSLRPICLLIAFLHAHSALACVAGYRPLTPEQEALADTVFIGHAVGYDNRKPAVITFAVDMVLQGKSVKNAIEVYWANGWLGESKSLNDFQKHYGRRNKIGIIFPETFKNSVECKIIKGRNGLGKEVDTTRCATNLPLFATVEDLTVYADKPWIISQPCASYIKRIK